ncbi:MAG TPA: hypothetical protein VG710_06685 [Opitutus sp.]|nr:hypothetical protein [Opitutus sp.]
MTAAQIVPTLVVPFIAWRVYSRVRRTIGRQHFRAGRSWTSVIIFSLLTVLIALSALHSPAALGGLGLGVVLAVPLGIVALRLTRFEADAAGKYYVPNPVIGVGVTLLFLGRLAYRMATAMGGAAAVVGAPRVAQSPLTLALYGLTAGYYVTYSAGLLRHKWDAS